MSLTRLPGFTLDTSSNVTFANANVTGNLTSGNANLGNLVTANFFSGNGSLLTGITITGTYSNTNTAAYLPTYTGNVSANYFIGDGSLLTSITGANITGNAPFASTANYANTANSITGTNVSGNVSFAIQSHYANIANSVTGTNVSGNVTSAVQSHYANIANAVAWSGVSSTPTTISGYGITDSYSNTNTAAYLVANPPTGTYSNTNTAAYLPTYTGNFTAGNINLAYTTTSTANLGNAVRANYVVGNGYYLTGVDLLSANKADAANYIANGTSNINTPFANGSITVGVGGTANVLVFNTTGINLAYASNSTANLGNVVRANYFIGNGAFLTGVDLLTVGNADVANSIANGTSNISTPASGGNITVGVGGNANTVIFTSTGVNVAGYISPSTGSSNNGIIWPSNPGGGTLDVASIKYYAVTGEQTRLELSVQNDGSGVTRDDLYFSAAGYTVVNNSTEATSTTDAPFQVTGGAGIAKKLYVGGNIEAGTNFIKGNGYYLTGVDQLSVGNADIANSIANGTSNISTPSSGGNITVGIGGTANTVIFSNTGVSVAGTLNVAGNAFVGNLTVTGTTTTVNSTTTRVVDPIFELGGGSNGAALSTDDNKDRGLLLHYYSGSSTVDAFMGWDDSNGEFGFGSNVSLSSEVVTWNSYANVRGDFFLGNGYYLSGIDQLAAGTADIANAIANGTSNINTPYTDGPITVGVGGSANTIVFTSTGINIAGYSNIGGTVTAGTGTGGSITGANAITSNYFIGNGSLLTNITGANVTGNAPFAETANYANTANAVAGANVSGNVTSATVSYLANITANSTNSGSFFLTYVSSAGNSALHVDTTANDLSYQPSSGNLTAAQFIGNGYYLTGITATASLPITSGTSNINIASSGNATVSIGGNANVLVVSSTGINLPYTAGATANLGNLVTANYIDGNGSLLTSVTGANISGQVSNALLAGTVYTNAQPNITSVGTLTGLTVGNATANTTFGNGTITATGNIVFTGASVSLGTIGNISITGGAANYFLKTDGAGSLSWAVPSGGAGGTSLTYTANTAPPASGNILGDQWFNTATNVLYEYINDGTSSYWVDTSSPSTSTNSAIAGTITIQDEGSNLTNAVSSINFVGAGVSASNTGNAVTVTVTIPDTLSPFLLMGA